jgi:hypothetical protein
VILTSIEDMIKYISECIGSKDENVATCKIDNTMKLVRQFNETCRIIQLNRCDNAHSDVPMCSIHFIKEQRQMSYEYTFDMYQMDVRKEFHI